MELKLPVDFERMTESRILCALLKAHWSKGANGTNSQCAPHIALAMTIRLFVDLAYLAQATNRPGWLTNDGAGLYAQSLEPLFGDGAEPVALMTESGWLKAQDDGWFCERFARLNGHLAGNYVKKEVRMAAASEVSRNKNRIAQEAMQQAMLLPPEIYKRRDGSNLVGQEIDQVLVVIKTVDNCLQKRERRTASFTESLIADAAEVIAKHKREELVKFYEWLILNRNNPLVPQTTEQILAEEEFARLWTLSGQTH
jgi:hypothetical protein